MFTMRRIIFSRNIFRRKERVSRGKKKSHGKRKSLMIKKDVSCRKKNNVSHAEKKYLMSKDNFSQKKTMKKLRTIAINKTIYGVLLL